MKTELKAMRCTNQHQGCKMKHTTHTHTHGLLHPSQVPALPNPVPRTNSVCTSYCCRHTLHTHPTPRPDSSARRHPEDFSCSMYPWGRARWPEWPTSYRFYKGPASQMRSSGRVCRGLETSRTVLRRNMNRVGTPRRWRSIGLCMGGWMAGWLG